jgi:predicted RNase H-like HicB family nuclease
VRVKSCVIEIERLPDGNYRAVCNLYPDCRAVAPTAEEARAACEQALEQMIADQNRLVEELAREQQRRRESGETP